MSWPSQPRIDAEASSDDQAAHNLEAVLHHVDLPKMDEAGIINYDRETGEIERGPRFDDAERILETAETATDGTDVPE